MTESTPQPEVSWCNSFSLHFKTKQQNKTVPYLQFELNTSTEAVIQDSTCSKKAPANTSMNMF